MSLRSFVAVAVGAVPSLVRLRDELAGLHSDVKAVAARNLHVTVRFLGDVDEDEVPALTSALREAAHGLAPFSLRLTGVGAFPRPSEPRVVWAGIEGADTVASIANALAERLGPADKPFAPHVTLARVKAPRAASTVAGFVERHRDWQGGAVDVRSVELMKSVLRPDGPEYAVVASVPLEA